jgi:cyclohexyl-isocyanide hydratase
MNDSTAPLSVGMVLFPALTQLDLTGPYEVFCRMPNATVHLLAETSTPIRTEFGLTIAPTMRFDQSPPLDILCVPGGWGVNAQLENDTLIGFLRDQAAQSRYITSVCSGAFLLGAAGLLEGYRATTHWMSLELLRLVGATPVEDRVVIDRNRITGAGVTAGIDLALVIAAELFGAEKAQQIQLAIEYDPAPPFQSGSRRTAPDDISRSLLAASQPGIVERRETLERVVARRG